MTAKIQTSETKHNEELMLRKLLWLNHGCNFTALYGDDGEMQCQKCMLDFKRDSAQKIKDRFCEIGEQKYLKEKGQKK